MKKLFAALAFAAVVGCAGAAAAAYPEKPVHVIVPSEAGGGTDTMARLLAKCVRQTPAGPGMGLPVKMQFALDQEGRARVLWVRRW